MRVTDQMVEDAARTLYELGNERIGHREWPTVADHYRYEARQALAVALSAVDGPPPAMSIDPATLLNDNTLRNGPLVVFWNQDVEVPEPDTIKWPQDPPRPRRIGRLLRHRAWRFTIRMAPPPGDDLQALGDAICERLRLEPIRLEKPDGGVWINGGVTGPVAPVALGAAGRLLQQLEGIMLGACQVRVDEWTP